MNLSCCIIWNPRAFKSRSNGFYVEFEILILWMKKKSWDKMLNVSMSMLNLQKRKTTFWKPREHAIISKVMNELRLNGFPCLLGPPVSHSWILEGAQCGRWGTKNQTKYKDIRKPDYNWPETGNIRINDI